MLVIDLQSQNYEWYREMLLIVFFRLIKNKKHGNIHHECCHITFKNYILS